MSRFQQRLWAVLPALLLALSLHSFVQASPPAPGDTDRPAGPDWTCEDFVDHELAKERDDLTIYIDQDGSMTGNWSGSTYWDAATEAVIDVTAEWHNGGGCDNNNPNKCDAVRSGVGFFGDDVSDNSLRAKVEEQAGEDKYDNIENKIDDETPGDVGDPGHEILTLPLDSLTVKTDTFTCPSDGTQQVVTMACPPNGTPSFTRVDCPTDGVKQLDRVYMPPPVASQITCVRPSAIPTSLAPVLSYTMEVDGNTISLAAFFGSAMPLTGLLPSSVGNIAQEIMARVDAHGTVGPMTTTSIYLTSRVCMTFNDDTQAFPVNLTSNLILHATTPTRAWSDGLPYLPDVGFGYDVRVNGGGADSWSSIAPNGQAQVAGELADMLNGLAPGDPIVATSFGSFVNVQSLYAGRDFTLDNWNPNNTGSLPVAPGEIYHYTPTPNVNGFPGSRPSDGSTWNIGTNFRIRVNGNDVQEPSTATMTSADLCAAMAAKVDAEPDVYTTYTPGSTFFTIFADSVGDTFSTDNISPSGSYALTETIGVPGLPGTPGINHTYSISIQGNAAGSATTSSYTDGGTPTQLEVCNGLAAEIAANHPDVTATSNGVTLTIRDRDPGEGFSIGAYDPNLGTPMTSITNSPGLPGVPGRVHTYTVDIHDGNVPRTITYGPTSGTPTSASVCAGMRAALNADPALAAGGLGTAPITVTPQSPGGLWTVTAYDSNFGYTAGPSGTGIPWDTGNYYDYTFSINGTPFTVPDDGSPRRAEICADMVSAINAENAVNGQVIANATQCAVGIVNIVGNGPAAFDVTAGPNLTHDILLEAGIGPMSFADLAENIFNEVDITDRKQFALVMTHRPPNNNSALDNTDWDDFWGAVDSLCEARDHDSHPVETHFLALGSQTPNDMELLHALQAAGGGGRCGLDPCAQTTALQRTTFLPKATMTVATWCSNYAQVANEPWLVDNRIRDFVRLQSVSCEFELLVPPSYPGGLAPNNTNATFVEIRDWANWDNVGDPNVPYVSTGWDRGFENTLKGSHNWDWWDADDFRREGWNWARMQNHIGGSDRASFTFYNPGWNDADICGEIRNGNIGKLRSHVACECANQGSECTFTPEIGDPAIQCKSTTAGVDTLVDCLPHQIAKMRCSTGVFVCDDGEEKCTATGDNKMPEICNGIDDDCDGIVDNMSDSTIAQFNGEDTQGKNCNFADTCSCPEAYEGDVSSLGGSVADHLDSWSGTCTCGEGMGGPAYSDGEPLYGDDQLFPAENDAACSVGMNPPSAVFGVLTLLGMLGFTRRRRRN